MFLLREIRQSDGFPIFDVCSLEIVYLKTSISHDCHDMATELTRWKKIMMAIRFQG